MQRLRLKRVTARDILRFKHLEVTLQSGLNIICGSNGVGKTALLDLIATFGVPNFANDRVQRRATAETIGDASAIFDTEEGEVTSAFNLDPATGYPSRTYEPHEYASQMLYVRTSRDFDYTKQDAVQASAHETFFDHQRRLVSGLTPDTMKAWLTNRFLFRDRPGWSDRDEGYYQSTTNVFSILDQSIAFSHVDNATLDVKVSTPGGIIPFEYLSSGFRSILAMVGGILIETYRRGFSAPDQFQGLILIDEVELHLHPSWQTQIGRILKEIFPAAQIVATTHSPHVVQASDPGEVTALILNGDGDPVARTFETSRFGFKGWSVEEVLTDVMGLPDTSTPELRDAFAAFDRAMEDSDENAVRASYQLLDQMLHPLSHLRKLVQIQAASVIGPLSRTRPSND